MKKRFQLLYLVSTLLLLIQIPACKKDVDCRDLEDKKLCSIKKVIYKRTSYSIDTAIFKYNALGDPVSVTVTNVGTANPNYVFKYDAMHRLTDFIGPYVNGSFEQWHKYVYGASGRVAQDTTYTFGSYNGGAYPSGYYYETVNNYTYDAAGRISQVNTVYLVPAAYPPVVTTYTYDAAGNLVRPGVVYDTKINFHRTNKVWQFVDRDYSVNNPLVATSYNPYLPLKFNSPAASLSSFLGTLLINESQFFYNCDFTGVTIPKGYNW